MEDWTCHLIQGCVQVQRASIENHSFDFVLLSRRSCHRAGFRYQRRGVDQAGNVANFVETEQIIMYQEAEEATHLLSFVQTRGSIPLYWSQSPQQRKPVPVLERSKEENQLAIATHFQKQKNKYGRQVMVSLVEQHGREAIVGKAYQEYVRELDDNLLKFVEFDIHQECRGMRYENIALLIEQLENDLTNIGYFWSGSKGLMTLQNGSVRTNCMDCLDRTNVVQCFIARHVMNLQLLRLGIHSYPEQGLGYYVDFEVIFNHIWANNGDAVSMAYTNTAALKGDVTRTGKRNMKGVINDGAASLWRLYQNNFRDGFRQTVVDLTLGLIPLDSVLRDAVAEQADEPKDGDEEVLKEELDAIETAKQRAVPPEEAPFVTGWVCLHLESSGLRKFKGYQAVEKIFLLSNVAYYICVYDFVAEKVTQFQRVPLKNIIQIQKGTYFSEKSETDAESNYAFIVQYRTEAEENRVAGTAFNRMELFKQASPHKNGASQQEKSDIFKIRSTAVDTSQSIAEQMVAKMVNAYLQLTDVDETIRKKTLVVDVSLNSQLERGSQLLHRMGELLTASGKNKNKTPRHSTEDFSRV